MGYKELDQQLADYPHIQSRLAGLWGKPGCREYLNELLTPERTDRQGFEFHVIATVQALRVLHDETYPELRPKNQDAWYWDTSLRR